MKTRHRLQTNLKRIALALMLTAALAGVHLPAGAAAPEARELDPVVVVATRTPLTLDRVSPSIDYISETALETWQTDRLTAVLHRQPGMAVLSSGATGSLTSLFSRGTESNHTSFFLEGRRLNPAFGNFYDLELLTTDNLSSVQVRRGASSVNYGSNGIGGVVDMRLQRSTYGEAPLQGSVSAEGGSNQTWKGGIDLAATTEKLDFTLGGSLHTTDNERPNDAYDSSTIRPRLDVRLNEMLTFELIGHYAEAEKELPGTRVSPTPDDWQETTNLLISPGLRYTDGDALNAHLFYARSESDLVAITGGPPVDRSKVTSDELSLQVDYAPVEHLLLSTGTVYREDHAYRSNIAFFGPPVPFEDRIRQFGAYGQALWKVREAYEFRGSLRFDDYSDFGSQTTGNLEAIAHLRPHPLKLFAKAATSFAPPSASDIAFDGDFSGTPLRPEESVSYELGIRYRTDRITWSLLGFRNEIDELLDFVFDPALGAFDTINVKRATTEGVEMTMEARLWENLSLYTSYTYLTATDDDQNTRLGRRPRHSVQLGATFRPLPSLQVSLQATGTYDREDVDPATFAPIDHEDATVARAVARWAFHPSWTLTGRVENLFDEQYEAVAGYPALGRTAYLGLKHTF